MNTRERIFADVLLSSATHAVDAARLSQAITATAAHRETTLRAVREATAGLATRRQADWQRYLTRAALADNLPSEYQTAIERTTAFADPILTRLVATDVTPTDAVMMSNLPFAVLNGTALPAGVGACQERHLRRLGRALHRPTSTQGEDLH